MCDLRRRLAKIRGVNWKAFEYYPPLERVHRWALTDCSGDLSLARAAEVAGFERTYFSSLFRDKVGVPYSAWVRQVRVQAAVRLLNERDYRISELARRVGYNNTRTLERAFRRETGLTPTCYKRQVQP